MMVTAWSGCFSLKHWIGNKDGHIRIISHQFSFHSFGGGGGIKTGDSTFDMEAILSKGTFVPGHHNRDVGRLLLSWGRSYL